VAAPAASSNILTGKRSRAPVRHLHEGQLLLFATAQAEPGAPDAVYALPASTPPDVLVPSNIIAAERGPDGALWTEAKRKEDQALRDYGVYEEVVMPRGTTSVGSKYLMAVKTKGAEVVRKVRMVAQELKRVSGHKYAPEKVYAPTASFVTLLVVIAMLAELMVHPDPDIVVTLLTMDVQVAYLNAPCPYLIYVRPPLGFETSLVAGPGYTVLLRLLKSLYGTIPAARSWYEVMRAFLISLSWCLFPGEACVFWMREGKHVVFLVLYVDDVLLGGTSPELVHRVRDALLARFVMRVEKPIRHFLGLEFDVQPGFIKVHQLSYTLALIRDCDPDNTLRPALTPAEVGLRLTRSMCAEPGSEEAAFMATKNYSSLVSRLA
jgi:hypothetical protein